MMLIQHPGVNTFGSRKHVAAGARHHTRSGHDAIAGAVLAGDLHPPLLDEGAQQFVQRLHHVRVAVDLERAELLDPA
ncbi:hypothetical protein CATMIT_01926, partial [Catenibacterium mitsuokai DSM 15897]